MSANASLAQRVKTRYEARSHAKFPTRDINRLAPDDAETGGVLHGRIELYLDGVAGYASSADRLHRRSPAEILKARDFLSQAFFDRYQQYSHMRSQITIEETPALYVEMNDAEQDRLDLLRVVEDLILSGGYTE